MLLILGMEPAALLSGRWPAPPAASACAAVMQCHFSDMSPGCAQVSCRLSESMENILGTPGEKAQHAYGSRLEAARWKDSRGCTPEESRGEDERGDSAWEDMDRGEVLPDMTGPSCACMGNSA